MNGASTSGAPSADLVAVLRFYVDKMLREVPGMKVLLLDQDTTRVVSTVFSQSEILEQEVYLVEKLEAEKGDQLFHLKVGAGGCRGRPAGPRGMWRLPAGTAATCPFCSQHSAHLPAATAQAVCFLRPTRENIARIRRELRDPRFGEYHLCECPGAGDSWLLAAAAIAGGTA
jgi:vacuolar protein sorting-associated protein 45